jgi:hypothetical protein
MTGHDQNDNNLHLIPAAVQPKLVPPARIWKEQSAPLPDDRAERDLAWTTARWLTSYDMSDDDIARYLKAEDARALARQYIRAMEEIDQLKQRVDSICTVATAWAAQRKETAEPDRRSGGYGA